MGTLLECDPAVLRPTQNYLDDKKVGRYSSQSESFIVPVMPQADGYVILDGHHHCAASWLGRRPVQVWVAEHPRDFYPQVGMDHPINVSIRQRSDFCMGYQPCDAQGNDITTIDQLCCSCGISATIRDEHNERY